MAPRLANSRQAFISANLAIRRALSLRFLASNSSKASCILDPIKQTTYPLNAPPNVRSFKITGGVYLYDANVFFTPAANAGVAAGFVIEEA